MSFPRSILALILVLVARIALADHNHDVALQYCDWIEANAALLNKTIQGDSPLNKDWRSGRKVLKLVTDYRELTDVVTWESGSGHYSVDAKCVGIGPSSIAIERKDGVVAHVDTDRLDNTSLARLVKIKRCQQELVLEAHRLYLFMIGAEDPTDPWWRFLSPLLSAPPKFLLDEPEVIVLPLRRWDTVEGERFVGTIQRKISGTNASEPQYVIATEAGKEIQISQAALTDSARELADVHLRLKSANSWDLKHYETWLSSLKQADDDVTKAKKDAGWRVSDEFRVSREALAETRRWIESQPFGEQGKLKLAFAMLEKVGETYREKDVGKLKNVLNNMPRVELAIGLATTSSPFRARSLKGYIEVLLSYSSAGNIYVRDADGEGIHLTLAEIWKRSAEINLNP